MTHHVKRNCIHTKSGFSLAELLIGLVIIAVMAALTIPMLTRNANDAGQIARQVDDLIQHMERACNNVRLQYGAGPMNARTVAASPSGSHNYDFVYITTVVSPDDPDGYDATTTYASKCSLHSTIPNTYLCNTKYRGMALFLPTWESVAQYTTGPEQLKYADNRILYLRPDETTVTDTSNDIPNNSVDAFEYDDIMATTDDRQWLLLDMTGTNGSNNIATDRVLLHVNDDTCKVLTARQKCHEVGADCTLTSYPQSFYDSYKCTQLGATSCTAAGFD